MSTDVEVARGAIEELHGLSGAVDAEFCCSAEESEALAASTDRYAAAIRTVCDRLERIEALCDQQERWVAQVSAVDGQDHAAVISVVRLRAAIAGGPEPI